MDLEETERESEVSRWTVWGRFNFVAEDCLPCVF